MAFDRSLVKDLPAGANVQMIKEVPYVFFRYRWRDESGVQKQARDYIGIIENNQFIPNDYYLRLKPTKEKRPEERWEKSRRKQKAVQAIQPAEPEDEEPSDVRTKSVGVTALAAAILRESGMIQDVLQIFGGDVKLAQRVLNLALGAAITAKPTYLSADESKVQMFFNDMKCPTSPRASELHKGIGETLDLSAKISRERIKRLKSRPLLALDGSRIDCNSDNIIDSAVGKKKDGSFGPQINFSLLVDAQFGSPVGYRWFAGSTNDVSTLEDFTHIWNAYGLREKDPMIVVDRGYYSQEALVKLGTDGYRFLAGAKTGYNLVKSIIEERNPDFYAAGALLENADFYGVQEQKELKATTGKLDVTVSVFRNPVEEMAATRRLFKRLVKFESLWLAGKADANDELLRFYKNPEPGVALVRNMTEVSEECYLFGYFAFVSNAGMTPGDSLETYRLRNEAEVVFKLMLANLMKTTRVHSTQALEGLLFTTFIALGILTELRKRMKATFETSTINSTFTIAELLARLKKIQVVTVEGKSEYLINVSGRDKRLIEALGFPGMFDSVENVVAPLHF